jgi:hypothetical protein
MKGDVEATRAVAHLPGLDIEVRHRQSPDGEAEEISIHLRAVPSFDALAQSIQLFNPFGFWAEAMRLAWLPWTEAFRALAPPPHASPITGPRQARLPGARSAGGVE